MAAVGGIIVVVIVVVGSMYALGLGPFARSAAGSAAGPVPFSQASDRAIAASNSQGGGPWVVWAATAAHISRGLTLGVQWLYQSPGSPCFPATQSYNGVHTNLSLPATSDGPSSGSFYFWVVQLDNASGYVRTVVVVNGSPSIEFEVQPSGGCMAMPVFASAQQTATLIDSGRIVSAAWNASGAQFVAQHTNASLTISLSPMAGGRMSWYWVVDWSTCPTSFGFHAITGSGVLNQVYVDAVAGTASSPTTQTISC